VLESKFDYIFVLEFESVLDHTLLLAVIYTLLVESD
jgi:hypothetical protein